MLSGKTLRVARPSSDLAAVRRFYGDGLGLVELASFADHAGFDGLMMGIPGGAYHFEFTYHRHAPVRPTPTAEDLVVFYLPNPGEWQASVDRLKALGYSPVASYNPYWDQRGLTFADPDGYRVVLQNAAWNG